MFKRLPKEESPRNVWLALLAVQSCPPYLHLVVLVSRLQEAAQDEPAVVQSVPSGAGLARHMRWCVAPSSHVRLPEDSALRLLVAPR